MKKKRNHSIPASILKYWVTESPIYKGVHVFDIRKNKKYFGSAEKPSPFSFTIIEDLYVPTINGNRTISMEDWFSGLETRLLNFIRAISKNKNEIIVRSAKEVQLAIMAIQAFEYRSRYNIEFIGNSISKNPQIRPLISASPDREIRRLVLENIIHAVTEQTEKIWPPEIIVSTAREASFLMCDRPLLQSPELEYKMVVLTNKLLLALKKTDTFPLSLEYQDCSTDFVNTINELIVLNARDWIVADSEALLDKYIPLIGSEKWMKNKEEDKISFLRIQHLTTGYSFKS